MARLSRYLLPGLLLLALMVRGGALACWPGALVDDPDGYRRLAENLVEYGVFGEEEIPTAYRPPLVPLLLVPCVALSATGVPPVPIAIGMLHLAMGLATVWLTFVLGRRWGLGEWAAAGAAALVACDPILLRQSTLVMTETAATLLAVVGLLALTAAARRPTPLRAAIAGGALAVAALCRPELVLWLLAAGLTLPRFARAGRWRLFGAFVAAAAVVLSPWAIRNQCWFGRPIVTTTHGGYTLLLANNPSFYQYLRTAPWGETWNADEFNARWAWQKPRHEAAADRMAYGEARSNIRRQPVTFGYACLVRVGRFWQLAPHRLETNEGALRRSTRYAVGLWYAAVFLTALIAMRRGTCRHAAGTWLWGALLVACLVAVHTVFWTNMRMRAVAMPVIALTAAAASVRREESV